MAFNWNFNAEEYEEKDFTPIPIGDYRCRVEEVTEKKSSSGNDMYEIKLAVSGQSNLLFHYIVLLPDNTKATNSMLGSFWDSFGIPSGTMDSTQWVGKIGGCRVKHELYNGETRAKLHYFHNKKKQESLNAWVEPNNSNAPMVQAINNAPWPTDADAPPEKDAPPFNAADLL